MNAHHNLRAPADLHADPPARHFPFPSPGRFAYGRAVPLLDTAQINAMAAGVPTILLPIVSDFKASGRDSIARLETALAARRFADAKDILHQLKGASGTMGLRGFQKLCAECEAHVVAGATPPRLPEFRALLDESVAAACRYLNGD